MSFGSPSPPPPPAPLVDEETPAEVEEARRAELAEQRRLRGRASHLLTSPQGVLQPVGVGTKALTGA